MGELLEGIFKLLGRLLFEVVIEVLLKLPGYAIVRTYTRKEDADPDGWEAVVWGVIFWVIVAWSVWYGMGYVK